MIKSITYFLALFCAIIPNLANSQTPNINEDKFGDLYNSQNLNYFYKSLNNKKPIHILWLGDSHTASDFISGGARDTLQIELGNAGRGFIDAGIPYKGFSPQHVQITTEPELKTLKSFPLSKSDGGPFGLGGYRAVQSDKETYKIIFEHNYDNFAICSRALLMKDNVVLKAAKPENDHITCAKMQFNSRSSAGADLVINGSKKFDIEIASIGVWNNHSGVVLSSFGVPGSTLKDLAARDDISIKNQIAVLPPSLIILAYGTNEGFSDNFNADEYKNLLADQIKRFKVLAPHADILLLLAPDANKAALNRGEDVSCKTLPSDLVIKYPQISHDELGAGYYIPPNLAKVRNAQIEFAKSMNIAYWDWHNAMGGDCSAANLSLLENREIAGDRVHFTKIGGTKIGQKLADDILSAIKYRLRH